MARHWVSSLEGAEANTRRLPTHHRLAQALTLHVSGLLSVDDLVRIRNAAQRIADHIPLEGAALHILLRGASTLTPDRSRVRRRREMGCPPTQR